MYPTYGESGPAIDGLAALTGDVERLSAYCRVVLPRAVVGYRSWQRRCSASARPARGPGARLCPDGRSGGLGTGFWPAEGYLGDEGAGHAAVAGAGATAELDQGGGTTVGGPAPASGPDQPGPPAVKARTASGQKSSDGRREDATVSCMFKKLLIVAVIVGVGFLAAKKMRAA